MPRQRHEHLFWHRLCIDLARCHCIMSHALTLNAGRVGHGEPLFACHPVPMEARLPGGMHREGRPWRRPCMAQCTEMMDGTCRQLQCGSGNCGARPPLYPPQTHHVPSMYSACVFPAPMPSASAQARTQQYHAKRAAVRAAMGHIEPMCTGSGARA